MGCLLQYCVAGIYLVVQFTGGGGVWLSYYYFWQVEEIETYYGHSELIAMYMYVIPNDVSTYFGS